MNIREFNWKLLLELMVRRITILMENADINIDFLSQVLCVIIYGKEMMILIMTGILIFHVLFVGNLVTLLVIVQVEDKVEFTQRLIEMLVVSLMK